MTSNKNILPHEFNHMEWLRTLRNVVPSSVPNNSALGEAAKAVQSRAVSLIPSKR